MTARSTMPSMGPGPGPVLAAALVFAVALATSTRAAPPVVDDGIAKEIALLRAEREALADARARIAAVRAERTAGLRDEIAALERQAALQANTNAGRHRTIADRDRLRATLDDTATHKALLDAARAQTGRPTDSLADAAIAMLARLEADTAVDVGDSMFFDLDGSLVNGRVARFGAVAAVAVGATTAGPLARVAGAWEQVPSSPRMQAAARDVVERLAAGQPGGTLPLWFGGHAGGVGALGAGVDGEPGSDVGAPGFFALTGRGGVPAWTALALAALGLCLAFARAVKLVADLGGLRRLNDTVPERVRRLDITRAHAECKRVGSSAGDVLAEIVRATTFAHSDPLEERAVELVLDENARAERVLAAAALAAGAALAVGTWALADALAGGAAVASVALGSVALSRALLLGAPALLLVSAAWFLRGRLRIEIERAALRVVHAAAAAQREPGA